MTAPDLIKWMDEVNRSYRERLAGEYIPVSEEVASANPDLMIKDGAEYGISLTYEPEDMSDDYPLWFCRMMGRSLAQVMRRSINASDYEDPEVWFQFKDGKFSAVIHPERREVA